MKDTEKSPSLSVLSYNLRELRRARKDLSQEVLAEAIGVTRSLVNMWEAGERAPKLDALIALSDYYGCSIDYLLGKAPEPTNDPYMKAAVEMFDLSPEALSYIAGTIPEIRDVLDLLLCSADGRGLLVECMLAKKSLSSIRSKVEDSNPASATPVEWYTSVGDNYKLQESVDLALLRLSRSFNQWIDSSLGISALQAEIKKSQDQLSANIPDFMS